MLQQQIDALKAEVAELRAQLWAGGPRLGPRPETPKEIEDRHDRMVKIITESVSAEFAAAGEVPEPLPPALCTTSGEPVAKVRSEQTEKIGQHKSYIVLCPDERAKGFVRPYRDAYKHVTCGTVTTMGRALSETYARQPSFYGATFCCGCNKHLPVAEFVWTADGETVGS